MICPPRGTVSRVALRKESVDRNIELLPWGAGGAVALRKESVDRNAAWTGCLREMHQSLSARRAWIEMRTPHQRNTRPIRRSPQGERG